MTTGDNLLEIVKDSNYSHGSVGVRSSPGLTIGGLVGGGRHRVASMIKIQDVGRLKRLPMLRALSLPVRTLQNELNFSIKVFRQGSSRRGRAGSVLLTHTSRPSFFTIFRSVSLTQPFCTLIAAAHRVVGIGCNEKVVNY